MTAPLPFHPLNIRSTAQKQTVSSDIPFFDGSMFLTMNRRFSRRTGARNTCVFSHIRRLFRIRRRSSRVAVAVNVRICGRCDSVWMNVPILPYALRKSPLACGRLCASSSAIRANVCLPQRCRDRRVLQLLRCKVKKPTAFTHCGKNGFTMC